MPVAVASAAVVVFETAGASVVELAGACATGADGSGWLLFTRLGPADTRRTRCRLGVRRRAPARTREPPVAAECSDKTGGTERVVGASTSGR